MSATDPQQRVSDQQRDRAVEYLQRAYASGALDTETLEERLGEALMATTRADLARALRGIARVATPSLMVPRRPAAGEGPSVGEKAQNIGAGLVHLSGLPTVFLGPAIVKAVATPGSRLWWEAGRAMSFQLTSLIIGTTMITLSLLTGIGEGFVFLSWVFYVVLSLVFSAKAFNGEVSTGRLAEVLPFRPEKPRGRYELTRAV